MTHQKREGWNDTFFAPGGIQITTHDERICHRNGQQVAVPGRETSVSRRLRGVSVAGFGQLFSSRWTDLRPVIFRGGVPDDLLRQVTALCATIAL